MYELKIVSQFAAAHQLRDFGGKCERLHGHNWKVEVYVRGERLGENGLLIDFKEIKTAAKNALERLDHQFLNDLPSFKTLNPSSENIAFYLYKTLGEDLNDQNVRVNRITVWESDSACATYVGT